MTAPRVLNTRFTTKWSDECGNEYKQLLVTLLPQIRTPGANLSLILSSTYAALNLVSKSTNKVNNISEQLRAKSSVSPPDFAATKSSLSKLHDQVMDWPMIMK